MKFTIVGSHMCPNTLYSIIKCKETGKAFTFCDVSGNLADLKKFLAIHEHDAVYQKQREMSGQDDYLTNGQIGLPCFVFEDGSKTLDLAEALKKADA